MSEKKLTKEQLLEICESMTDKPEDLLKTCGMLMRLPPEIRQEIYYMIKGPSCGRAASRGSCRITSILS